jgi:hypothetical protein
VLSERDLSFGKAFGTIALKRNIAVHIKLPIEILKEKKTITLKHALDLKLNKVEFL